MKCDINDLINGYLKSFDKAMTVTYAELDKISELILTYQMAIKYSTN